jgi:hypothetical protein
MIGRTCTRRFPSGGHERPTRTGRLGGMLWRHGLIRLLCAHGFFFAYELESFIQLKLLLIYQTEC